MTKTRFYRRTGWLSN